MVKYPLFSSMPTSALKEHIRLCVEAFFAEKLINRGFINYNNEYLSWYKVVNSEVLLSVCFMVGSKLVPPTLQISYGTSPLFLPVKIPQKIVQYPSISEFESAAPVFLDTPMRPMVEDAQILCTASPGGGSEKLDEIVFPIFDGISSFEDAYAYHKSFWKQYCIRAKREHKEKFVGMRCTLEFVDETIYINDEEALPLCIEEAKRIKDVIQTKNLSSPTWSKAFERASCQLDAMMDEKKRLEHIAVLEAQKQRFIKKLEKKLGIVI